MQPLSSLKVLENILLKQKEHKRGDSKTFGESHWIVGWVDRWTAIVRTTSVPPPHE
jgi:hypothetical protein